MKRILLLLSMCLLMNVSAQADHGFYLNGLIINDAPMALINERTVKMNDVINGWTVESMDEKSVTLRNKDDERVTVSLPENQTLQTVQPETLSAKTLKRFNAHLQKSADNLYAADQLFNAPSVAHEALYTQIIKLCDSAEREAQHALELSKERSQRFSLDALINAIRNLRAQSLGQRKNLKEDIEESIKEKSVLLGMRKEDARKSWGRPLTVNYLIENNSKKEEWIYRRVAHKSTYLYFENDILTAIAY